MIQDKRKRIYIFGHTFVFSLFICLLLAGVYVRQKSALEYSQMEQLVITYSNKVSSSITDLLYKTQTLATLVIQNDGRVHNFEQTAAVIVDNPCIRNVILAPDGIVTDVYPLEGNEAVLGFDYFSDHEGNAEAVLARKCGSLVLGGPFTLVQGGMALVGRLPVYLESPDGEPEFWGLVSITLSYPQVLENIGLEELQGQGLAYEIWRISPDTGNPQMIAGSDYSYDSHSNYIEQAFTLQNAQWYFRLSPIQRWYEFPTTWIFILLGLLMSLLCGFLVLHNYDLKKTRSELEALIVNDPLTGVLNRRGLFNYLNILTTCSDTPFILCYLDLNHFKSINDTCGHLTGDQVLVQFSHLILENIDAPDQLFARMGGDEFILIFTDTADVDAVWQFLDDISQRLSNLNFPIPVSFSAGISVFPLDGKTVDELIHIADQKMYVEKSASRSQ